MSKPRLVACDVDGTLLKEGQTSLPKSTMVLISQLLDAGIVFVPASGRQYANLRNLFARFADRLPFVAENGTIAFMDGKPMFRAEMERGLGDEIVQTILARPGYEVLVSGVEASYIQPKDSAFVTFIRDEIRYTVSVVDDMRAMDEQYSKISGYRPNIRADEAFWHDRFDARCTVAVSGSAWIDFIPKGASKALGLRAVCRRLGIAPGDVVAIGDNDNDVEMLDFAGLSIVMASGSERAKAHARRSAASADDALSAILGERRCR